jgi:hypothetical protein
MSSFLGTVPLAELAVYMAKKSLNLFKEVLKMCVSKGMVRGNQAVDSVFIKANASMDSLVEKEVLEDASAFVNELKKTANTK